MEARNLHDLRHPNVPFTASSWAEEATLHVAVVYSNPLRWRTRRQLFNDFRRHIDGLPNIKLYVGELAYGERPFEVTREDHPLDFQWRTRHELWHKENLLNLVIQRFDEDWKYGAYMDGDFTFNRHDLGLETIHQLQHYDWVQMFSTYTDIGYNHEPVRHMPSFAQLFVSGQLTDDLRQKVYKGTPYSTGGTIGVGATGGAWAFRREALEKCGGLLDTCILGSGDWHMAFGLASTPDLHPQTAELTSCGKAYGDSIKVWQKRAEKATKQNIGVVNCYAVHHYHGEKSKRGYEWRWKILRDNDFNPATDIYRDAQGVYQLTPEKPRLRDDIRRYFRSRDEDR